MLGLGMDACVMSMPSWREGVVVAGQEGGACGEDDWG